MTLEEKVDVQVKAIIVDNIEVIQEQPIKPWYKKVYEAYMRPKRFEKWRDGLIYKCLGVDVFKYLVPNGGQFWRRLTKKHALRNAENTEETLKKYEQLTRSLELIHQAAQPLFLGTAYIFCENDFNEVGLTFFGANILVNAYPILLQRYNRARIYNRLEKMGADPISN